MVTAALGQTCTLFSISPAFFVLATSRSYFAWRFIQSCGVAPKYRAKRRAVSAVILLLPVTMGLTRPGSTSELGPTCSGSISMAPCILAAKSPLDGSADYDVGHDSFSIVFQSWPMWITHSVIVSGIDPSSARTHSTAMG
jgi:hypothetical protein